MSSPSSPTEQKRNRPYIMVAAEADFKKRLKVQAERFGMSVSTYVRLAAVERLERDEESNKP